MDTVRTGFSQAARAALLYTPGAADPALAAVAQVRSAENPSQAQPPVRVEGRAPPAIRRPVNEEET